MRTQVQSLASLSGLRIQCCQELWCSLAATAVVWPLAWKLPHAAVVPRKFSKPTKYTLLFHPKKKKKYLLKLHTKKKKKKKKKTKTKNKNVRHSYMGQWIKLRVPQKTLPFIVNWFFTEMPRQFNGEMVLFQQLSW